MSATIEELTNLSLRIGAMYSARFGSPDTAEFALSKMTEELGEVVGAHLKVRGQSRGSATKADLADEIGDLLGFLLIFAAREGIDPGEALRAKWGQYLEGPAT